jgi:uncharacterized membrane protein
LSRVSNHLQLGADRLSKGQRVNNKYSTIHSSYVKLCTMTSCVDDNYWYHALTRVLITIFAITHLFTYTQGKADEKSLTPSGESGLRVSENRVLRRYLGLRGTR